MASASTAIRSAAPAAESTTTRRRPRTVHSPPRAARPSGNAPPYPSTRTSTPPRRAIPLNSSNSSSSSTPREHRRTPTPPPSTRPRFQGRSIGAARVSERQRIAARRPLGAAGAFEEHPRSPVVPGWGAEHGGGWGNAFASCAAGAPARRIDEGPGPPPRAGPPPRDHRAENDTHSSKCGGHR